MLSSLSASSRSFSPIRRIASRLHKASIVAPASTRYLTANDPTARSPRASRDDAAMPNIASRTRQRLTDLFGPRARFGDLASLSVICRVSRVGPDAFVASGSLDLGWSGWSWGLSE